MRIWQHKRQKKAQETDISWATGFFLPSFHHFLSTNNLNVFAYLKHINSCPQTWGGWLTPNTMLTITSTWPKYSNAYNPHFIPSSRRRTGHTLHSGWLPCQCHKIRPCRLLLHAPQRLGWNQIMTVMPAPMWMAPTRDRAGKGGEGRQAWHMGLRCQYISLFFLNSTSDFLQKLYSEGSIQEEWGVG